jgi:hypothetical protein
VNERHLYFWVDSTTPEAELALHTWKTPSSPPQLPADLDAVWVGTWGIAGDGTPGFERLLHVTPTSEWANIDQARSVGRTR